MGKDNQQLSLNLKEDSDYVIYNDGRLFSKKTNKFLKGKIDNMGYQTYGLAIGDKISSTGRKLSKMVYAHRLVAEYFLDNPDNLPYVHHKDENKLNNHVSNLEWVTAQQNKEYSLKDKQNRKKPKYFEKNLPGEKWMTIPEHLNYDVSSCGRVRNNRTNRLLHLDKNQKYLRISFPVNGKTKHYYIFSI